MGEQVERFPSSGSRVIPTLGLVGAALFVVLALADGWDATDLIVLSLAAWASVVIGVLYLRPAVWATEDELVLRSMLSTVTIPLAAVDRSAVGRFLVVFAADRRYVSTTVTRSLHSLLGGKRRGIAALGAKVGTADDSGQDAVAGNISDADLAEQKLARLTEDARARAGVRNHSDEQRALAAGVRRTWSVPVIAALVVTTACVLLALVLV